MDVFQVHEQLIADYAAFTLGFTEIRNRRIREHVENRLSAGEQWPDPYLALNPNYAPGGSIPDLVRKGLLHPECEKIFRLGKGEGGEEKDLQLHRHQREAVEIARTGVSYVLTTGTGSGKSLSYIVPIVDWVLRRKDEGTYRPGVKAIIVYPMNALANSQVLELEKFLRQGYGRGQEPVTFHRYTGQERGEERDRILADPPDILLTNYVMLDLVLTRPEERKHLITAARGLHWLVLDELHTYRGRQGADVAMLVRRVRDACGAEDIQCVGTSATMTTEGSEPDRRRKVAEVATRLFGVSVSSAHVIGETLERVTTGDPAAVTDLTVPEDYESFIASPLASWVETRFGVTEELTRPPRPLTVREAARELSDLTGRSEKDCVEAIQATLQRGASLIHPRTERPLFAFRLHQFLSKGDDVYVSIEPEDTRYITSRYQTVVPEPGKEDHILVPVSFCRECGQEYLTVRRSDDRGITRFTSRRESDVSGDETDGYLYVSDDFAWPDNTRIAIDEQRLPEPWLETLPDGSLDVVAAKKKYLPEIVHVAPDGRVVSSDEEGTRAAYIPSPFTFCLRCRTSYEQIRGSDFAKLGSLAVEGRSSATSVISSSVVRTLREDPAVPQQERKLLAFTDNRQDASLQAGHFNDFVQVVQLRGALYRALLDAPEGLTHKEIVQRVTDALNLRLADFAQNPEARFTVERNTWQALRQVIAYRLYVDLERGWRITMPNLEQTGLLKVDYLDLPDIAAAQDLWDDRHHALRDDVPEHREELLRTLLDELRRVLAIDVDCLTPTGFEQIKEDSRHYLKEPWAMDRNEQLVSTAIAYPRPGRKGSRDLHLTGYGVYGRYLLKQKEFRHLDLTRDDATAMIRDMLAVLAKCGVLAEERDGYQIKASSILWKLGDGKGAEDRLRKQVASDKGPRVNPFFRDLYREKAANLAGMLAREHTAQVSSQVREEREQRFREGDLQVLYCSPTMELGIDIKSLGTVVMRNVPPTPANYAQRAGRAGRSGQPALVVTYCATGNAHDQYYFRHRDQMVGGSVAAPRLDLTNEDLIRSHVHAIWLAETELPLDASIAGIVNVDAEGFPLFPEVAKAIHREDARQRAAERARFVLAGLVSELENTSWWHRDWIDRAVADAPKAFDAAFDRWRDMYATAKAEREEQHRIIGDHSTSKPVRDAAMARRREAENQLRLLCNEESEDVLSDFYSYRYLAAEGFLPGYSFPRLPLRAYIPDRKGDSEGEFIHRPRFIAIREFGPDALIYHEGSRYQVKQVQLSPAEQGSGSLDTRSARHCEHCGYLHETQVGTDVCEECGGRLGRTMNRLLRLQTVKTVRRDRISSDEEERRRAGYELVTSYRFNDHGARPGRLVATAVQNGRTALELRYGDSATVRVTNMGRRRRRTDGFWINVRNGRWLSEKDALNPELDRADDADLVQNKQLVLPYVEDSRNILVTRLPRKVGTEEAISFMYALERGIEAEFQLEDNELTSELLPDHDRRGRALFIESSEGGAGVLRRLVLEEHALAAAARRALRIAHFDPETGADTGGTINGERCAKACYDCLLSFSNQPFHDLIDRRRARDLLLACAGATVIKPATTRQGDLWEQVRLRVEGDDPRHAFVVWLEEHEHRLPERVAPRLDGCSARPDLVYPGVAVFVDGPDDAATPGRDEEAEEELRDRGWSVIRVPYGGDYAEIVKKYPSVFGVGRRG
ncbi:ATP-dependent helicase YprA (DUF1998 family) [Thermopolyspora flexuosa]|uniref:ATP-dependent helicase YprA (DUF1998 family) n=1 Tax=Thermopolyspora flexuosa TaxID=103836 RepID=A0A543J3Q1_9ACTN|nr:DEAD/DEAH box helicase [Thermopolyspora flexuosa]TQM77453.1 ATP-dependent helicase YprA (DUF1998 family) [Thermopolyspora flexuosa]